MKKGTISYLASMKPIAQGPENSYLVNRIGELILMDIEELEVEDLRLLVSQSIALNITIPLSVKILKINPFAEGDYYNGDLLKSVLSVEKDFWDNNIGMKKDMVHIAVKSIDKIDHQLLSDELKEDLISVINNFLL